VVLQYAQALDMQGRAKEARGELEKCLERFPDRGDVMAELGRILLRDGESKKAESLLHTASRLDLGAHSTQYQYFLALKQNGKVEEAARQQEKLQRLEADLTEIRRLMQLAGGGQKDPSIPHRIAMIALRSGQPKEALRWMQKALQVDPDYAPTHRALAALYRETGDPILASRHRALAQRSAGSN
jgi:tetratricopeptide (TPR) repeat protein